MKIFVSKNVTSLSTLQMDIVFDFETLIKLMLSVGFGGSMLRSTEFYFNSGSWRSLESDQMSHAAG